MKSLLYHGFGIKGYRYLRTRYEKGEIIFELEPEKEPEVPTGQKLRRHGYRWRTVRSVSIGLKPVVLKPIFYSFEAVLTGFTLLEFARI